MKGAGNLPSPFCARFSAALELPLPPGLLSSSFDADYGGGGSGNAGMGEVKEKAGLGLKNGFVSVSSPLLLLNSAAPIWASFVGHPTDLF